MKTLLILLTLLVSLAVQAATGLTYHYPETIVPSKDFYVSPTGSDLATGGVNDPFQTLEKARDTVRTYRAANTATVGAINVFLRGGKYFRNASFTLTSADSGQSNCPTIWQAFPGETPEIIGGVLVTNWVPLSSKGAVTNWIPSTSVPRTYVSYLPALGITNYGAMIERPDKNYVAVTSVVEVIYGDKPMTLARWPNVGYDYIKAVTNLTFTSNGDRVKRWHSVLDTWAVGFWAYNYMASHESITNYNSTNGVISIASVGNSGSIVVGHRFYLENAPEELDAPGEYYLDRTTGQLYFIPPDDIRNPAYVSLAVYNMSLTGVKYTIFRGIKFNCARAINITATTCTNLTFEACSILNGGKDGIFILDGQNVSVFGCEVAGSAERGVNISGGSTATLTAAAHSVINCNIHDIGHWTPAGCYGVQLIGVGHLVSHTTFSNIPQHAIFIKGNDHIIEWNRFEKCATEVKDSGVVYHIGSWAARGCVYQYNSFYNIKQSLSLSNGVDVCCFYMDDCTSGSLIRFNTMSNIANGIEIGGGRDNIVSNNIVILADGYGYHLDQRAVMGDYAGNPNNFLIVELNGLAWPNAAYAKYAHTTNVLSDTPNAPKYNVFCNNVFNGLTNYFQFYDNANSNLTYSANWTNSTDPGFIAGTLLLATNSAMFTTGYVQIPMDRIGRYSDGRAIQLPSQITLTPFSFYTQHVASVWYDDGGKNAGYTAQGMPTLMQYDSSTNSFSWIPQPWHRGTYYLWSYLKDDYHYNCYQTTVIVK